MWPCAINKNSKIKEILWLFPNGNAHITVIIIIQCRWHSGGLQQWRTAKAAVIVFTRRSGDLIHIRGTDSSKSGRNIPNICFVIKDMGHLWLLMCVFRTDGSEQKNPRKLWKSESHSLSHFYFRKLLSVSVKAECIGMLFKKCAAFQDTIF